jgi:hypothetical protein
MPAPRRLPPQWPAEKLPGGYVIRDANGQAIAYVYCRATETDAMQAKVLTDDESRAATPVTSPPRREGRGAKFSGVAALPENAAGPTGKTAASGKTLLSAFVAVSRTSPTSSYAIQIKNYPIVRRICAFRGGSCYRQLQLQ